MLYAFGFDKVGVVVCDLLFADPHPTPGQEGAEVGARLEVRLFERGGLRGSIYSARPIAIEEPIWRADLLESISNIGSLDRAHHHPRFRKWEPGKRRFVEEMSTDPVLWVGARLADLDGLLAEAGVDPAEVGPSDTAEVRAAVPEIMEALERSLAWAREAGRALGDAPESLREGWL